MDAGRRAGGDADTLAGAGADRCQRLLGICFLGELDVNGWLVANGHAVAYTQYSRRYVAQEASAKQHRRGMHAGWFMKPWDWCNGER